MAYPARGSGCSSTPLSSTLIAVTYWIAGIELLHERESTLELASSQKTFGDHMHLKFPGHVTLLIKAACILKAACNVSYKVTQPSPAEEQRTYSQVDYY